MSKDKKTKISFDTKDVDGNSLKLAVIYPDPRTLRRAQTEYNAMFYELVNRPNPAILREALDTVARKQGLWDDAKQAEYNSLNKQLNEKELMLRKGGLKRSEARSTCIAMRGLRAKMTAMRSWRGSLDNLTAQGQSDNHSFSYIVSQCTVYDDGEQAGKPYFGSFEDLLNRGDEAATVDASSRLMTLIYGVEEDFEKKLPENYFLLKLKLVDDKLRLINDAGELVDEDNRRVNEEGFLVNSDNKPVDIDGNLIDVKTGDYIVDTPEPFLNDDGTPLQDS